MRKHSLPNLFYLINVLQTLCVLEEIANVTMLTFKQMGFDYPRLPLRDETRNQGIIVDTSHTSNLKKIHLCVSERLFYICRLK